jgi:adenylosuccinate synthase
MLTCVTDLAFGDTGKGKIVDAISASKQNCSTFQWWP